MPKLFFLSCEISLVYRWKCPYRYFSSRFCFLVVFVLLMLVMSILFLAAVISFPSCFLCSFLVIISMYQRYLKCWWVFFLLLFWTHRVCLCHFWDVRPYALSCVFLFTSPFVEILLLSTLRMVSSILQEEQPKYLSLWGDFCYKAWFQVVLSFSRSSLFSIFLSSSYVRWWPLPIIPSICQFPFLRSFG